MVVSEQLEAPAEDVNLDRRFGSLDRLYGPGAAECLQRSHVAVVGIGGVGSWAAEALARAGIGTLTLIDMDHIAESNINRQIHALSTTLGTAKIVAMRERIVQINPHCKVNGIDDFVEPENWPAILPDGVDIVIDACDQVKSKVAMTQWARAHKRLFVTVGAAGGKRHAHKVDIADLSETTHDPLLAQVRYRLRKFHQAPKEGKRISVASVFSREAVQPPPAVCDTPSDGTLNCHGYGSLVSVTATFGMCAAGWAIDKICERHQMEASKNKAII